MTGRRGKRVFEGLKTVKEKEKLLYARIVAGAGAFVRAVAAAPRRFWAWGRQRTSIVIAPHSARASRRLQFSLFALGLIGAAALGLFGFSAFSAGRYAVTAAMLAGARRELADSQAAIDELRDSVEALSGSALRFETKLSEVLEIAARRKGQQTAVGSAAAKGAAGAAGTAGAADAEALGVAGLTGLLNMQYSGGLANRELDRLTGLSRYLDQAAPGLEQLATILAGQKEIMSEIPNIWPIQGGVGHISMYFGQNENPFSGGQWYLHTGIDISTFGVGNPILATADGKVIDVSYDGGLGNSITIQHSHGFLTRYGHLRSTGVRKGQQVVQGQVIATLGNSGKTTGPHLHYEVHLGTSLIDPLRFLNIRKAVGQ
ncbi:M23 family metallopeptidase [bacterium]|nr:M23 family metallopeptidase [bacterium]